MAERLDYQNGQAHALNCLGTVAQRRGELKNAERLYAQAAYHAEASADRRLLGMVELNQGVIASSLGDWDTSIVRLRLSLKAFESVATRKERRTHTTTSECITLRGSVMHRLLNRSKLPSRSRIPTKTWSWKQPWSSTSATFGSVRASWTAPPGR